MAFCGAGVQGSEAVAGQELGQEVSDTVDWPSHTSLCPAHFNFILNTGAAILSNKTQH